MSLYKYYALAVISGREKSISQLMRTRLKKAGYAESSFELIAPDEEVIIENKGERVTKRKLTLPGYLLIKSTRLSAEMLSEMLKVKGVLNFLGDQDHPMPLPISEVEKILGRRENAPTKQGQDKFKEGAVVRITDGPLSDFTGTIKVLNARQGTAEVEVEIFGRMTPTTVKLGQLARP